MDLRVVSTLFDTTDYKSDESTEEIVYFKGILF